MNRILLLCFLGFLSSFRLPAQSVSSPIDIPILLSGNFGELRANHFHSGIDFKTQGKIGLPIKAVMDGYVSRISVSPFGYGRALYINHPNGTTTVYGHLDRFAKEIESFVQDSQYVKQTFRVDLKLSKETFHVKQGEVVAYGGNTGSSGGPHLHFEIRDTETEEAMDPLPAFMTQIDDSRKPQIQSLMVYPEKGLGIVNGKSSKQIIAVKKNKAGNELIVPDIEAWGEIGFGVKAYDYMDGTSNLYGVKQISLSVDGKEVFHSEINRFAFSDTRYLNSFIDWEEWQENRSFYMKSFVEPGNALPVYVAENRGIILIDQEKIYKLSYTLKDLFGNTTVLNVDVQGKKELIPAYKPFGTLYAYNKNNHLKVDGVELDIPKKNLYTDIYFTYSMKKNYTPYAPLYRLYKRWPLHSYCPLSIVIENDSYPEKNKYGIISVVNNRASWVGGTYDAGKMSAEIRELGDYSVTIDTVSPVITELKPTSWTAAKCISFKIRDNLSGISAWSATLGGKFILFEYDAKTARLFCEFNSKRMKPGQQNLELWVEDACGNRTNYKKSVNIK